MNCLNDANRGPAASDSGSGPDSDTPANEGAIRGASGGIKSKDCVTSVFHNPTC